MLSLLKKSCIPTKIKQKRKIMTKALPPDAILFDYVDAYVKYICPNTTCIDNLVIPEVSEQLRVLEELSKIQADINTYDLDGVFMKFIIVHDQSKIELLKQMLEIYQNSKDVINEMIKYSYMIQVLPSEIPMS